RRGTGADEVEPIELAAGRSRVVAVYLYELQHGLGVLPDRRGRRQIGELSFAEDDEGVEMCLRLPREADPLLRRRLELDHPPRAGSHERARDRVRELDPERMRSGSGGEC